MTPQDLRTRCGRGFRLVNHPDMGAVWEHACAGPFAHSEVFRPHVSATQVVAAAVSGKPFRARFLTPQQAQEEAGHQFTNRDRVSVHGEGV